MIHITFIVQFIISIISCLKYKNLKRISHERTRKYIYFHETESFFDAYKIMAVVNPVIIITLVIYYLMQFTYQDMKVLLIINNIFMSIGILILQISLGSMSLYAFSEVKHISRNDEIGIKCYKKYTDTKEFKKVKNHFLWLSFLGLLGFIVGLIQMFIINIYLGITYMILILLIFILGMSDVLQHPNYNSKDYKDERKKLTFFERHYLTNILQLFREKEYRKLSLGRLHENITNIILGIKEHR